MASIWSREGRRGPWRSMWLCGGAVGLLSVCLVSAARAGDEADRAAAKERGISIRARIEGSVKPGPRALRLGMLARGLFPVGSMVLETAASGTPATWSFLETTDRTWPTLARIHTSLVVAADRDLSVATLGIASAAVAPASSSMSSVVAIRDQTRIRLTKTGTRDPVATLDVPFGRQIPPCLSALLEFLKACPAEKATYRLPWLDPHGADATVAEALCTCHGTIDASWPRASGRAVLFEVDAPGLPLQVWLAETDRELLFARETVEGGSLLLPQSVLGWPAEAADDWATTDRPAATAIGAVLRFLFGAYTRSPAAVASALRPDLAAGGAAGAAVTAAIEGWYPRSRKTTKEDPVGWDKATLSVPFEVEIGKDGNTRRFALDDEGKTYSLTVERTAVGWFVSKY